MIKNTPRGIQFLTSHEGLVTEAYKDSVGVLTWSIGITNASGHKVDRYIGNPQTIQQCVDVFLWVYPKYEEAVIKAFAPIVLNENQLAAAVSFHYNTGGINKATWVKEFKAGDKTKARKSFMNWSKPKSIISRRQAECDLFFDAKWSKGMATTQWTKVDPSTLKVIYKSAFSKVIDLEPYINKNLNDVAIEEEIKADMEDAKDNGVKVEAIGGNEEKTDNSLATLLQKIFDLIISFFTKGK